MQDGNRLVADYTRTLRRVASTVVMVTSYVDGRPWGLTVSAFCPISVNPPLCFASVFTRTATYVSILQSGVYGVSVLSAAQVHAARYGSAPSVPKFLERYCSEGTANAATDIFLGARSSFGDTDSHITSATPEVQGAVAHYHCELDNARVVADHGLLIGRVRSVTEPNAEPSEPLLYWDGGFRRLGPLIAARLAEDGSQNGVEAA